MTANIMQGVVVSVLWLMWSAPVSGVVSSTHKCNMVDLTHELSNDSLQFPTNPYFQFLIGVREQFPNYWYESNTFSSPEHLGTHLDSPAHFYKDAWRVHEIPVDRLIGPLVKIDITRRAAENPNVAVTVDDLLNWERKHGQIKKGSIVIMDSGWADFWPDRLKTFGDTDVTNWKAQDGTSKLRYPGWSIEAIDWLLKNRLPFGIGVDTPSLDPGSSTLFPVHVKTGSYNVYGLENVANLKLVRESGAVAVVMPIKIRGGSGAPVRIVALNGRCDLTGQVTPETHPTHTGYLSHQTSPRDNEHHYNHATHTKLDHSDAGSDFRMNSPGYMDIEGSL
ncbi:isatin hydrolase-like [Tubulanus polymorphus]|uniref:isatin hydrolase-like n=1 Tax=Tubulanus polymorphus TaxID=672921 RepID=UPI003DA35026